MGRWERGGGGMECFGMGLMGWVELVGRMGLARLMCYLQPFNIFIVYFVSFTSSNFLSNDLNA